MKLLSCDGLSKDSLRKKLTIWFSVVFLAASQYAVAQQRAPIPSAEKQQEIVTLLQETYNLSKLDGTTKKQDAIKRLMRAAHDEGFGADEKYVVLTTVISLATETGDGSNWLAAVNSLNKDFELDPQERLRLVTKYLQSVKTGAQLKPVLEEAMAMSRKAAQDNRYGDATSLLNVAESAVQRATGTASLKPLVAEARESIIAREKDWKAFQAASMKLATNADDASANYIVGRWHVFQLDDWKTALPYLAKASDAKWKAAAELERSEPTEATGQVAIADSWWELAQRESGTAKAAMLAHSGYWYETVLPKVTSALKKQQIAKRLEEIPSSKKEIAVTSPQKTTSIRSTPEPSKSEWVDLLAWTEGTDWSFSGINWNDHLVGKPTREGVTLKKKQYAHFPLSAIIDGNYELEVTFTRHEGNGDASLHFPVGSHTIHLLLGSDSGSTSQVSCIDRKVTQVMHPGSFENNKPHRILVRAQRDGEKARFNIDFDNTKDFFKWEGNYTSLIDADSTAWKTTALRRVWVGSHDNERLVFNRARVRMQSGKVHAGNITDADREQDLNHGYLRLVGQPPEKTSVGAWTLLVNQTPWELGPSGAEHRTPQIAREFRFCDDFYGVHAPSRLKCSIPSGAKSFSVVGYNAASRTSKFLIMIDGKQVYDSGVTELALIKLDVPAKSTTMELVADDAGDPDFDHTYWCFLRFHTTTAERITDKMLDGKPGPLKFSMTSSKGDLIHNKPIGDQKFGPIHFEDVVPCDEFLFAHAPSKVTYQVPPGMTRFTAIGYNVVSHAVRYEVWADGKMIYESPEAGIVTLDVKLPSGTKSIELKINDAGNAWGDQSLWCYPRLHRK